MLMIIVLGIGLMEEANAFSEKDTITNWQVYLDDSLLFRSHEFEDVIRLAEISAGQDYDSLRFNIFYDFAMHEMDRSLEIRFEGSVLAKFDLRNPVGRTFNIRKEAIDKLRKAHTGKILDMIYYDEINTRGLLFGRLQLLE